MYQVDELDRVVELRGFPQSSVGAPCPLVLSDECTTVVAFHVEERDPNWDGITVRVVDPDSDGELVALLRFGRCYAHVLGPPNDEAFSAHPLASRGLQPYSAVIIENSSWVRGLEQMNAIHPHHRPEDFKARKHFILSFHDSVFECVAEQYEVELCKGAITGQLIRMAELLSRR